jgi:hypothetical protein
VGGEIRRKPTAGYRLEFPKPERPNRRALPLSILEQPLRRRLQIGGRHLVAGDRSSGSGRYGVLGTARIIGTDNLVTRAITSSVMPAR